jgi:photosystem II protein
LIQASAKGARRLDATVVAVKDAVRDTVREQRPYELFNGRLAMMGISAAFVGKALLGFRVMV